ncbi:MAG: flavodoxin family protein [Thomasclavelia sp.]
MKILVLQGSPHKQGSSNLLASEFIKGAKENNHQVEIFDVAHANLHPCLGCDYCNMSGPCVQKDDMSELKEKIIDSDVLVFVTPLYYFGMSAQLKIMVDRFYSFNGYLTSLHKKAVLIGAAWNSASDTMDDLASHYQTICDYLSFDNLGMVLGLGCGTVSMTQRTKYMDEAYRLGKSI